MKKIAILIISCVFAALCSAQSMRPMITDLQSTLSSENTYVLLTWSIPKETASQITELLVYRNSGSIIRTSSLSILEPRAVLSPTQTSYKDDIQDYSAYYYAVVARTSEGGVYDVIIPTVNASDTAIVKEKLQVFVLDDKPEVENIYANAVPKIDSSVVAPLRERPLPNIDILATKKQDSTPTISEETLKAVNTVPTTPQSASFFKPLILEQDTNTENATGDDYTLSLIVNSSVALEDWVLAEQELLKFLQVNRTSTSSARANFYLAQSYYFQQEYRKALTHFQKSEKAYPVQSKKWIEEVLNRFTI